MAAPPVVKIMEKQKELFDLKRVIVFIDGSNLYHGIYRCYKYNYIDIVKLSEKLCNINRSLCQIRYYFSYFINEINPDLYIDQQKFLEKLKIKPLVKLIAGGKYIEKPIVLKKEHREKIKNVIPQSELYTYVEKGLDIHLAKDILLMAVENKYDAAILVSGDGDFVPIIEEVKKLKKKVQVAAFNNDFRKCYDLKNAASSFIDLGWLIPSIIKEQKL